MQQIHLKDTECSTENTLILDADTITTALDISKNKAMQTDDRELFIMCYDHIQAQHEENLTAADTIENVVDHFHTSLSDILEHSDWNFQILAYQFRPEFHGYMQYALTQASAAAIPVPEPVDFQMLQTTYMEKQEKLPNLHIEHYAIFEQQALQDTDKEIQHQAEGARPKDPTRPWSLQPFGRRTRSQASFARQRAWQEQHRQSKCQQQFQQVIVTSAVQAALAHDTVAPPLKPYAEKILNAIIPSQGPAVWVSQKKRNQCWKMTMHNLQQIQYNQPVTQRHHTEPIYRKNSKFS